MSHTVNAPHWLLWWGKDHLEPRREICHCDIGEAHNKDGELATQWVGGKPWTD